MLLSPGVLSQPSCGQRELLPLAGAPCDWQRPLNEISLPRTRHQVEATAHPPSFAANHLGQLFLSIFIPPCQVFASHRTSLQRAHGRPESPCTERLHLPTEAQPSLQGRRRDHRREKDSGKAGSKATSFSPAIRLGPFPPSYQVDQPRSKLALG